MRCSLLLRACYLLLVPAFATAGTVHIQEVGLEGYYSPEPAPTRVRVQLTNARAESQSIELRISVTPPYSPYLKRVDTFRQTVVLGPGEQRGVEVPLLLAGVEKSLLQVDAVDANGQLLGRDRLNLDKPVAEHLVAVVCAEQAVCQAAQTQISFSGTPEEQLQKGRLIKLVAVREPPPEWWAYTVAHTVVVAVPLTRLSADQRQALEDYARQAGRLVLVEDVAADPTFLASYRRAKPRESQQVIGMGRLVRVRMLRGPGLADLFTRGELLRLVESWGTRGARRDELRYVRKRLATSFAFPGLGWLLKWLLAYTLVVGPLSFILLRRLGRREWGWVTLPLFAVVFAGGLYLAGAAKRPKSFGLDEVTLYWLDDRSPVAASEVGLRVSSPERKTVSVTVPGDAVFTGSRNEASFSGTRGIAFSAHAAGFSSVAEGWQIQLGPPRRLELPLLQWSFRDLDFRALRTLPGTVRWLAPGRLRNETTQTFRDAVYVDKANVYFLGGVAPATEIDLNKVQYDALDNYTGRGFFGTYPARLADV